MNRRAWWVIFLLYMFYVVLPWSVGALDEAVFVRASVFSIVSCGALWCFFYEFRASPESVFTVRWLAVINVVAIASGLVVLVAGAFLLRKVGFGGASLNRADLFLIREEVLNPLIVLCLNLCIICSSILISRHPRYYFFLLLPIGMDVLTQGRAFILSSMIALVVFGRVSFRVVVLVFLVMIAVTALRIDGGVSVVAMLEYVAGESLNTAFGNGLVGVGDFSVGVAQGVRSIFSLFPFLGGLFNVESEAVAFNELTDRMYGYYGLAFGVLGFAKFSSWSVMFLAISSALLVFFILVKLGMPKALLSSVVVTLFPVYFRWSPAEYFYVVGRVGLIFLFAKYLMQLCFWVKSNNNFVGEGCR